MSEANKSCHDLLNHAHRSKLALDKSNKKMKHTLQRAKAKDAENDLMVDYFVGWFHENMEDISISKETFIEDLSDGVILCKMLSMIDGCDPVKYMPIKPNENTGAKAFKSRCNISLFNTGAEKLKLKSYFSSDAMAKPDLSNILTTLSQVTDLIIEQMYPSSKSTDMASTVRTATAVRKSITAFKAAVEGKTDDQVFQSKALVEELEQITRQSTRSASSSENPASASNTEEDDSGFSEEKADSAQSSQAGSESESAKNDDSIYGFQLDPVTEIEDPHQLN